MAVERSPRFESVYRPPLLLFVGIGRAAQAAYDCLFPVRIVLAPVRGYA